MTAQSLPSADLDFSRGAGPAGPLGAGGALSRIDMAIVGALAKVPGVRQTETHLAFRAYSRHDLDATFSIGISD